ncbi:MAG: hypothetical protein PVI30_06660 [Myxococcales bacterium]|jgi:hypothetical protein
MMDDATLVGLTIAGLFAISVVGYIRVRASGMPEKPRDEPETPRTGPRQQGEAASRRHG